MLKHSVGPHTYNDLSTVALLAVHSAVWSGQDLTVSALQIFIKNSISIHDLGTVLDIWDALLGLSDRTECWESSECVISAECEDSRASADVSVTLCFSDLFPGVCIPWTYVLRGQLCCSWPLLPLLSPQPVQLDAHTGKTLLFHLLCGQYSRFLHWPH